MKKIFTRLLAICLMLAMLVPAFSLMTSAAEIENLYDPAKAQIGTPSTESKDADANFNENYATSNLIEVKAGDVITMGPVMEKQGYYLTTYDEAGAVKIKQVKLADCTKVDTVISNALIVSWTVTEGTAYIRMATSQMFTDCTVVTKNAPFTAEDYFAAMAKANINVEYLKPTTDEAALKNIFPVSDATFAGRADTKSDVEASGYRTCDYVPVKEGDIVYFYANIGQGYQLVLYNAEKKGTTRVTDAYMVLYEDLGDGKGIFAYKMRPGTAFVRVVAATANYDEGKVLATINQPFVKASYNAFFEPPQSGATGDSSYIFAVLALVSVFGVAFVAKKREN